MSLWPSRGQSRAPSQGSQQPQQPSSSYSSAGQTLPGRESFAERLQLSAEQIEELKASDEFRDRVTGQTEQRQLECAERLYIATQRWLTLSLPSLSEMAPRYDSPSKRGTFSKLLHAVKVKPSTVTSKQLYESNVNAHTAYVQVRPSNDH